MKNRGFSLVEIAIVLVILGLLTGGVLTGQSLIRAAELRSIPAEYQRYSAAIQSFRDKYLSIPGDMTNATSFWGAMTNCGVASPSGTGTQTCNGNGNGIINDASATSRTGELFGAWQHLANAGLIEGTYTGISGTGSDADSNIDINVPSSKMSSAGWTIRTHGGIEYSDSTTYFMNYRNFLVFGSESATGPTSGAVLRPEEAWNIDTKIDDGKPAYGNVIARYWNNACTAADDGGSSATDLVASYRLTDTTIQCSLMFRDSL